MSNNSTVTDRSCRRTLSAGASTDEESQKGDSIKRRRQTSEHNNDLNTIEEIVTCSIHLGIMENPRKLGCQHAFCSECLLNLVKVNGSLTCPICRTVEANSNVRTLPSALVEKQLIEVVMQKRITNCINPSSSESAPLSKEGKEELVKHLMLELKSTSSAVFKFDGNMDVATLSSERTTERELTQPTSSSSVASSTYDLMDIETIRENMLKHSCYEDVKHNNIKKVFKHHSTKRHCRTPPDFKTFDINVLPDQPESYEVVLVDSVTHKFFVYTSPEPRCFNIYLDGIIFRPSYIRILRGDIFATGIITDSGVSFSLFLQSNLYGKVIRKSDRCRNSQFDLMLPMFGGFDVDQVNEKYFVCTPLSNAVQVYNTSLVDCRQRYDFDSQKPEFVTYYHHQNQIWVSCPDNRRILIADIETGAFMMFRTDQINDAIPKMIYCFENDRIVFLDSRLNRFIWIKRRGDYILTQKLHFRSISEEISIKAFQTLPNSLIVIGTPSEFMVFQPVKLRSKLWTGLSSCSIL